MLIDDEIEDFILTSPSTSALQKKAIKKGMTTMKQDGLIKI
jgi:type II secretory ATPase GspE/PulE/Tfp pilus assembly ATPase PilB-like protein